MYDTVSKFGWRVDVRKHPIREVILKVIEGQVPTGGWDEEWECEEDENTGDGKECGGRRRRGTDVPIARSELECVVSCLHTSLFNNIILTFTSRIVSSGSLAISKTMTSLASDIHSYVQGYLFIVYVNISCIPVLS